MEHHKSGHRCLCDGDDDALDDDDQKCNDQNENDHTSRELTQLIILVVIMWSILKMVNMTLIPPWHSRQSVDDPNHIITMLNTNSIGDNEGS